MKVSVHEPPYDTSIQFKLMIFSVAIGCKAKRSRGISFFLSALIILAGFFPQVSAGLLDENSSEHTWHISADEFIYEPSLEKYIATGSVAVTKGERTLKADRVIFEAEKMIVRAEGNAVLISGKDTLAGAIMEMDLEREIGTIYQGDVFFQENHFYIEGDRILKTGEKTYFAEKVSVTTCDGENPAWKITARKFGVTLEGYATAKHAVLWARGIPVLYSPFLVIPAKTKRQTGFLFPQFGYSDRKGYEYVQPFFWAIDKHSDATFYEYFMSLRGSKVGVEYRYVLSEKSKGSVMADFLSDQKVDDGTGNSSRQWGYEDDGVLRTNSDRYWFRMKHDQELPKDFQAKLDLDIVSDQDYLQEFRYGYAGFEKNNDYFVKTFGRDLDTYDDAVRVNRLNVSNQWQRFQFDGEMRWNDDVVLREQGGENDTLQRLPYLAFTGLKQPAGNSDFFFDLQSNYNYFYRVDGIRGNRLDLYPRIYHLNRFGHYLTVEPSLGLRETLWMTDGHSDTEDNEDETLSRELYDFAVDTSTELSRTYEPGGKFAQKIRHAIRPQIVYRFMPSRDQEDFPFFDEIDRVPEDVNLVTYALTNTFSLRQKNSVAYRPFCRFKLEQSYLFDAENDIDEKPFSPIFGELELVLGRYFSLDADARWSTETGHFLNRDVAVKIADTRGDRIFVEYAFNRSISESLYADALMRLTNRLSAYVKMEKNLRDSLYLERGIGVIYMSQCWSLDLGFLNEPDDKKYFFMISLYGIGEVGDAFVGRRIDNPYDFK